MNKPWFLLRYGTTGKKDHEKSRRWDGKGQGNEIFGRFHCFWVENSRVFLKKSLSKRDKKNYNDTAMYCVFT